ncbi:hypothetical protein HDU98_004782, partial [Podochytrium sp. JEL0797]
MSGFIGTVGAANNKICKLTFVFDESKNVLLKTQARVVSTAQKRKITDDHFKVALHTDLAHPTPEFEEATWTTGQFNVSLGANILNVGTTRQTRDLRFSGRPSHWVAKEFINIEENTLTNHRMSVFTHETVSRLFDEFVAKAKETRCDDFISVLGTLQYVNVHVVQVATVDLASVDELTIDNSKFVMAEQSISGEFKSFNSNAVFGQP